MLLSELYGKTKELLGRKLTREQVYQSAGEAHARAVRQTVEHLASVLSSDRTLPHLEAVDSPAYLQTFPPDEIAEHIRQIEKREPVVALFKHHGGYSEVTVIGRDHPFALSQFCGVLTVNDANIFDAHIFTRSDGIIIDRFRVFDFVSGAALGEAQCAKIQQEVRQVVAGEVDLQRLLARHHLKWRRRRRLRHANVRIDVELEDHPRSTIIDVYAVDALGFLYRITEVISRLGLNIAFAKIATRADGIVDSFYVTDRQGRKITDAAELARIRAALLRTVRELADRELMVVERGRSI
jgi:[protein-PII] uridylyltransferase